MGATKMMLGMKYVQLDAVAIFAHQQVEVMMAVAAQAVAAQAVAAVARAVARAAVAVQEYHIQKLNANQNSKEG